MKYIASLLVGIVTGAITFCLLLYFNPFASSLTISPLAMTQGKVLNFSFPAVPDETLAFTNNGEIVPIPHPEKVLQLWESTVRDTSAMAVILSDSRGNPAGIGIKFQSESEETEILDSKIMVNSVWHIHLPDRGTMLIDQSENHWSFVRDVVIGAHRNSADNWRGKWNGVMTVGPNALGSGRVTGGNGEFAGIEAEAVESLNAGAYSVGEGPVAMTGNLAVSIPDPVVDQGSEPQQQAENL